jgi:hypothetical protein
MKNKFNPKLRSDVTPRAFLIWILYFVTAMSIGYAILITL